MLDANQIASYQSNGYLTIEDVLTVAELEELRRVTDEFVEKSRAVTANDAISISSLDTARHHPACAVSSTPSPSIRSIPNTPATSAS